MARGVHVRVYAGLNDLVAPSRRGTVIVAPVAGGATVKAVIEDLGIPHTEVDLVLANGEPAGFDRPVADGDRLAVFPRFVSLDVSALTRVRPPPPAAPRFLLDVHLGTLARILRMLGFDAAWDRDAEDEDIVAAARREDRIVLSRDRGLLKRRLVRHGCLVRASDPRAQAAEVIERFGLRARIVPFGRCLRCNASLRPCGRGAAAARVPPAVAAAWDVFHECTRCGRVYWKGNHWKAMRRLVESLGGIPR